MRIIVTNRFERSFKKFSKDIKKRTKKQIKILVKDSSHPSLNVKKVRSHRGLFEGRITKDYRFTFSVIKNAYVLHDAGKHDEILN